MKNKFLYLFSMLAVMAGVVACGDKVNEGGEDGDPNTGGGDPVKIVTVGAQNGTIIAGTPGSVTYTVTTENIADGNYTVSVANRPTGVEIGGEGKVNITDNAGTLTLAVGATATAGTVPTLRLTLDGTTSNNFALQIFGGTPSVSVGSQTGMLWQVDGGTANFKITLTNMIVGEHLVTVNGELPAGVSVVNNTLNFNANGEANLQFTKTGTDPLLVGTTAGLTVTVDGTISSTFSLEIRSDKKVTVRAQSGWVKAGVGGVATFEVATEKITNGSYPASVANLPSGVEVTGQVTIEDNIGTLTLTANSTVAESKITNLTLTIDDTTSGVFTFTILGTPSISSVAFLTGTLFAGEAGTASYTVTAVNFPAGTYNISVSNLPANVTAAATITLTSSGKGTLTLTGSASTSIGSATNVTLTIEGIISPAFTVSVIEKVDKMIQVGAQDGTVASGTKKDINFPITQTGFGNAATALQAANVTGDFSEHITFKSGYIISPIASMQRVSLTVMGTCPPGAYNFKITYDGTSSNTFTLNVN